MKGKANLLDHMHRASLAEALLDFGRWAARQNQPDQITVRHVREHFPVGRATAYRWTNAWRAINGLPPLGAERNEKRNLAQ